MKLRIIFLILCLIPIQFVKSEDENFEFEESRELSIIGKIVEKDWVLLSQSKLSELYFVNHKDKIESKYGRGLVIKWKNILFYDTRTESRCMNYSIIENQSNFIMLVRGEGTSIFPKSYIIYSNGNRLFKIVLEYFGGDDREDFFYFRPSRSRSFFSLDNKRYAISNREFGPNIIIFTDENDKKILTIQLELINTPEDVFNAKPEFYFRNSISDSNVNLRSGPSLTSFVVNKLEKGDKVRFVLMDPTIKEVNKEKGYWVLVETENGFYGWIWDKYLLGFSIPQK